MGSMKLSRSILRTFVILQFWGASGQQTAFSLIENGVVTNSTANITAGNATTTDNSDEIDVPIDLVLDLPEYALEDLISPRFLAYQWLLDHPRLSSLTEDRKAQMYALVTWYYSMQGDKWDETAQASFLNYDISECNWSTEVLCRNVTDGNITYLYLSDLETRGLEGIMPAEVAMIPELRSISITNCGLDAQLEEDMLPLSFYRTGLRRRLRNINYSGNRLEGTIPTRIGRLNNLNSLNFDGNSLDGPLPSELGLMDDLVSLRIESNRLTSTIPTEIANLMELEVLALEGNRLTGSIPFDIGALANLEELQLQNNRFNSTIPLVFGVLIQLKKLRLEDNQFSGTLPAQFSGLTNLEELNLENNPGIVGTIPPQWGNLQSLTELRLGGTQLVGVIPRSMCQILSINILEVNCSNVECPAVCTCQCQQAVVPNTNTTTSSVSRTP
ncbi:LRR receptor-like serine threonine-protein kinase [Seminavis robusta]|uniref:LRR receptor-like serine threonine-protein kinase n=1 Tax=Seminavis robusta TaxID=568900 RepID=A0A9N8DNU3_9STRA|nr:LRR receptor-like serine threonine-protein kinase [Seminavis robusta]|eukprot:Sro265_g102970.1 LRR receptor-like serine threonine-protein kinase (443) ;mRNA; r:80142-81887